MIKVEDIGKRIYKLRIEARMTQEELANKLSITQNRLSIIENGLGCPTLEQLQILHKVFDISYEYIIDGKHPDPFIHKAEIKGLMKKLNAVVKKI